VADKLQNPVKARPRAPRFPFVANVELVDVQSEARFRGRVTDLSMYGCGVAASKSPPAGAKLSVRITSNGSTFSAVGKVAHATSDGDMGIVFARVERNDQTVLEQWISELRDR
jgi:hypothetical protein